MIQASKETLQTALTNNSFDLDMTEKIIRMAQDNSYQYLYKLQRNIVIYEEHFYTTTNTEDVPDYGDLYLDKRERVCINFPVDLIGPGYREKFRLSKYHTSEIDISSFNEDVSLFYKLPIITIDNHVLKTFSVKLFDDHFVAILPFDKNFLFEKEYNEEKKHYIYIKHNIQLQVVNNVKIYDLPINNQMLKRQSRNKDSYDTLLKSYVRDAFKINLSQKSDGMYFAVIYTNNNILGSQLHPVTEDNDTYHIELDQETSKIIDGAHGNFTIRLIYFKYCHMHIPYHKDDGSYIKTRVDEETGKVKSDMFLIQKEELRHYDMPVPTENLFIQKFKVADMVDGVIKSKELYSNENVRISYPNIYRFTNNTEGDGYRVFYFYQQGYDLKYRYMYQFFLKYLYFKWGRNKGMCTEELINAIYFKDLKYYEEESDDKLVIDWNNLVDPALSGQGVLLVNNDEFDKHNEHWHVNITDVELKDDLRDPNIYSAYFKSGDIENPESTPMPLALAQFESMFNFVIDNDPYDYIYDDIDYMRNYSHKMSSFDYKTYKLKKFIADDFGILHRYVLAQNKVSIKFGFNVNEDEMKSRYRTKPDNPGSKLVFTEPMYLFTFDNSNPKGFLVCRIFIDGLLCTDIHYDSYQFSNYVYIPVRKFKDSKYVEIEIYPSYHDSRTIRFDYLNEYVDLEFEPDKEIIPTITDLYFELPDDTPIDKKNFSFQLVYDEFTYSEAEQTEGYKIKDGSGYYIRGEHSVYKYFNEFCIRDSNKDISEYEFDNRKRDGEIIDIGKMSVWNNELDIVDDIDYVEFIDVCDGKSIINPFNVGVYATKLTRPKEFSKTYIIYKTESGDYYSENGIYHKPNGELDPYKNITKTQLETMILNGLVKKSTKSDTLKVRVRLLDDQYYDKDILVKIDKESIFKYQVQDADNYPCIEVPLDNYNCTDEYLRIFREGRKISKNQYALIERRGKHYLQYFQRIDVGKEVAVDLTPYRNRLVYYKEELSPDENGEIIIDLKNHINKPFDIKYYDVYLNGRRLTRHNIFPFSPYQFKLSDVHSIYHFEVYEKDRDWEYYGCDFEDYLTASDLISKSFIEKTVADEVIDDITGPREPNDNCEEKEVYDKQLDIKTIWFEIFYFNELLPLIMTNPDIVQCEDEAVKEFYEIVWEMYNAENDLGETVLFLNPDVMHEGEKTDEGDYKDRFYTLWNDDKFMDTH